MRAHGLGVYLMLLVRLWHHRRWNFNNLAGRDAKRELPAGYYTLKIITLTEIRLLREEFEEILVDGLLRLIIKLDDQAPRTEMNRCLLLTTLRGGVKGIDDSPVEVAKDIKELDRASEILDVLLALLQVERVKATLLLCKTQHLY